MADAVDMKAMFKAKMGFSSEDVPLDDEQLENFLMLCHQSMLGISDDDGEENEVKVKKEEKINGLWNILINTKLKWCANIKSQCF